MKKARSHSPKPPSLDPETVKLMTPDAIQEELALRMAWYGADYGDGDRMTVGEALLAGFILREEMHITEQDWNRLG